MAKKIRILGHKVQYGTTNRLSNRRRDSASCDLLVGLCCRVLDAPTVTPAATQTRMMEISMCPEGGRLEREHAEATASYNLADIQQRAAITGDAIKWASLKDVADRLGRENMLAAQRLENHRRQCRVCLEEAKKSETE